ncbi:hypothetical protein EMM73_16880 [Rheinheimera sediminis]|uniref:hypothetical protein n=1 Tax=Rheinheimera sp. YQF-1 TaxID=2499626 RepID=UPI000FD730C0|nr:hypothetical protein [Rheinheimera sp. YQF-1]RVT44390.1 hypothetical protein EMM73_16880 [Rheinheimera sp. YQF-1]
MKQERRREPRDLNFFWDMLNMAQKFSVSELQRYGYELSFVRQQEQQSLAVLKAGAKMASIDQDGQINTAPRVFLRD